MYTRRVTGTVKCAGEYWAALIRELSSTIITENTISIFLQIQSKYEGTNCPC